MNRYSCYYLGNSLVRLAAANSYRVRKQAPVLGGLLVKLFLQSPDHCRKSRQTSNAPKVGAFLMPYNGQRDKECL